jgi:hypothetical protein
MACNSVAPTTKRPSRQRIVAAADDRVGRRTPFGNAVRGRGIVINRNEAYLVPVVARAIDISERLQHCRRSLTVEDIHVLTGYPKSTIYRILRTLAAFGYVEKDFHGTYKLSYSNRD